MKTSGSKIIRNMFLLLTMAFLIPSIAKAALITSSGGNGKEATPHQLTIGHCEDDTFTYTVSSGCISASSLSSNSFLVKQGETVTLIIRSGSNPGKAVKKVVKLKN